MSPTKDKRNYFGKEILALKLCGVSLSGDESLPYKIYSWLFLPPTVFIYPLLDIYEYFKHDKSVIADIIVYQIGTFLALCKTAVVLRNRLKFGILLAKLEREPFIPNVNRGGQVEEELITECTRVTSAQTLFFWGFTFLTVVLGIVYTAFRRITSDDYHDWQMPYGPFSLFNGTYSPGFEINWLYQNTSILFIGTLYITIDLLLAAVLAHITYHLKILQNILNNLVETGHKKMLEETSGLKPNLSNNSNLSNKIEGSAIPWKYLKKSIQEAVEYHVSIIDIAREIDEVYSYLLLTVFLGTLILICFSTYAASSVSSRQAAVKHLGEGMVSCVQVATVCFWGERVFQESQLVGRAAYESNFVGTDVRFQNMLAFIIRRSQNPIKITAGKFADICLATFGWGEKPVLKGYAMLSLPEKSGHVAKYTYYKIMKGSGNAQSDVWQHSWPFKCTLASHPETHYREFILRTSYSAFMVLRRSNI